MSDDEQGETGSPEAVAAAYEQFRSGMRPRQPSPAEEAALSLAIEISNVETSAFIEANRETPMAYQFPVDIRETALNDLALLMDLAAGLQKEWSGESDPAGLLDSARAIRDAASALSRTIERLWPKQPPSDYTKIL